MPDQKFPLNLRIFGHGACNHPLLVDDVAASSNFAQDGCDDSMAVYKWGLFNYTDLLYRSVAVNEP